MKKILSIMLTVLMCFSSIFGSVVNVAADSAATFAFSNVDANAGDTVEIPVTYTSAQAANLIALAEITLSSADAEIIGFTYSESANNVINVGLSNYDSRTQSIITLFDQTQPFDGVLGVLEVKISDDAQDGEIVISAASVAINEDTETKLQSSVVDGIITVGDGSVPAEKAIYTIGTAEANPGQTVTVDLRYTSAENANLSAIAQLELSSSDAEIVGFVFSDSAKEVINTELSNYDAETKSVITLFKDGCGDFDGVLGSLQIMVSEDAAEGDITINATSRVQNEDEGIVVDSEVIAGVITVVIAEEPAFAKFIIGEANAEQGETVEVDVDFETTADVNLIALAQINVGDKAEIIGFEFDDEFKNVINEGLSNYDPETKSLIILFNEAMVFEGLVGKFTVKIADDAPAGDIVITATSRVQNEEGEGVIDSEVVAGKITVAEKAVEPEMTGITVTANNVEIADADKDDVDTIKAAIAGAITSIKAQWTDGEDTDVDADDVTITVDTANKKAVIEYNGFEAEIFYTVAAPVVEEVDPTITFADADVVAGEVADVEVSFETTKPVTLLGIEVAFSSEDAQIEDFVFSDEAKALINEEMSNYDPDKNAIVVLFNEATVFDGVLGTLKVSIAQDAEDGTIDVDAATFNAKNEDEFINYNTNVNSGVITVSEDVQIPVVTDISVNMDTIEVPYAKSEKIAEYIKIKITVELVYDIGDPVEVDDADVVVTLDEGKAIISVNGYEFTKEITYTIDDPIIIGIEAEKLESKTYEWDETPSVEDAKEAYGKIYISYDFDNDEGCIKVDVTEDATFGFDDGYFTVSYAGLTIDIAQYEMLSAPETLSANTDALSYPYGTEDLAEFVKSSVTLSVEREDGTAYEIKDGDIEITISDDNTEATIKFLPKEINDVVITLTELDRVVESIDALPETITFEWNEEVTVESVKAKIDSVVVTYEDDADPKSEEIDGYTVTIDGNVATISYAGAEDTIEIIVSAVPQTGITVDVDTIEIPYGTKVEDIADIIADSIAVYPVYADDSIGDEAIADFVVNLEDGRPDQAEISVPGYDAVVIEITYATEEAYIYADRESVSVPYNRHNGKTAEEIAEYIATRVEITYVDEYGVEAVLTEGYTVTYEGEIAENAEGVATFAYEDLEATVDVTLKKKSSGGGSGAASGTVVGTGGNKGTNDGKDDPKPVDPEPVDPEPVDPEPIEPVDPIGPSTSELPYIDVTVDDWAYEAIKDLYNKGVVSGGTDNTIRLDVGITRQEVAKVVLLGRGFKVDETLELNVVDPETVAEWADGYVATAMAKAIIKGYEDGSVKGSKIVTRAELAAIIVRSLGATAEFNGSSFTDVTDDDWFAAEVECAKSLGIITGYKDGSFRGNQEVTRREAFVMVQRMMKLIEALEQ